MSIFRQRIEEAAQADRSVNPPIQSGWLVNTENVIEGEWKTNPYLMAMSNMSYNQKESYMKLDNIKTGNSVVIKDTSSSRNERVLVNPKTANNAEYGTGWGKNGDPDNSDKTMTIADLAFSGTNNQLPTIFGNQRIQATISNLTLGTPKDVANNVDTSTASKVTPVTKQEKPLSKSLKAAIDRIVKGNPLPPLIDKNKLVPVKRKDNTERGIYGDNLRTGTTLVDCGSLSSLAGGNYDMVISP